MTHRVEAFIHQSLAGAGLALLDPTIMATLRPDLWGTNAGIEASHAMGRSKNMINGLVGVRQFLARIEGYDRDIPILARASTQLHDRIEWVLGKTVLDLVEITASGGDTGRAKVPTQAEFTLDRNPHITSVEAGRTCSVCDHLTAGHACRKSTESGHSHPPANVPHRCLSFSPLWNAIDPRSGHQLWPELVRASP